MIIIENKKGFSFMESDRHLQSTERKIAKKTILIFAASIFCMFAGSAAFIMHAWENGLKYTGTEAIQLAEAAEAGISKSLVAKLIDDPYDTDSEIYKEIKYDLMSIAHLNNNIRFSNVLVKKEDKIRILVDSEPEASKDSSPPGQIYNEAGEEFFLPFNNGQTVLTKPNADRWGNWISVLVPMKNPKNGETIAVFAVDYPTETWGDHAKTRTLQAVILVLCIWLIFFIMSYAFIKNSELKKEKKKLVNSEMRLKESEKLFRTVFEQAMIGIAISSGDKIVTSYFDNQPSINPMFEKITGRKKEELVNTGWTAITHPDDLEKDTSRFEEFQVGKTDGYEMEKRYIRPDGSVVWVNMNISPLRLDSNDELYHICLAEDISMRKGIEKALKESEQSKSVLLDNLPGMAYRCNYDRDWTMQFVSKGCFELTGYRAESLLFNKDLSFNDLIAPKYRDYLWDKWEQLLKENSRLKEEYEIITASGEVKWVLEQGQGINDEEGNVIALEGLIIDITERKRQEMKLKYISEHDLLTGLFNRRYFEEVISEEHDRIGYDRQAVILLNIRNFSRINLTYGYAFAETLIKNLAYSLNTLCTESCRLFHISIDRFVFYIENYSDKNELEDLSNRILTLVDTIKASNSIQGNIGIFEIEDKCEHADNILKYAGMAAEQARYRLASSYCYFDREMEEKLIRKETIKKELAEAAITCNDQLYLEYQPIVEAKTYKIHGFEALARFRSEKLGIVSPGEFIPLAEETQLIVPLGKRVMQLALSFLKDLENKGYGEIIISFNVSPIQLLRDDFIPDLSEIIRETGVRTEQLNLEITESVFSNDYQLINNRLSSILDMGIRTSIDDFGTGYSSLARERELNIKCTKIDKFFIDKLVEIQTEHAITGDIISMAHKLGQYVVAEGVEHEVQREYLIRNNCDYIQGYLFSKPLSMEKAVLMLETAEL